MGNQLRLGSQRTASQSNLGISTGCIACYPCHQATTDNTLTDISGNSRTGVAGAALVPATAFASPQGITTAEAASTDTTCRLALADFTYSFNNGDTLLIATRVKLTALPAASKPLWAQGGNNTAAPGWALSVKSTGELFTRLDHAGGQAFGADTNAAGPASDGKMDTNWRSVVFAFWGHNVAGGTASYCLWIDGTVAYSTYPKTASSLPTSVTPAEAFRIGQYYRTSGPTTTSIGGLHSYVHLYRAPVAVTNTFAKMDALAKRLYRFPGEPLNAVEWPMT